MKGREGRKGRKEEKKEQRKLGGRKERKKDTGKEDHILFFVRDPVPLLQKN